jgi:hypothetical protein
MKRFFSARQGPWIVASAVLVALLIAPFASGQVGSNGLPIIGGKRSPSPNKSKAFTAETEIIANNSTYGTRQSNKSATGGGAIYGCRAKEGGTDKGSQACVRASNLAGGRAFEFATTGGPEVGRITSKTPGSAPFTTNATGVATGLNSDKVDGKDAADILADAKKAEDGRLLFAAVADNGTLGGNRGAASSTRTGAGDYTVVFAADISACALNATQQTVTDAGAVGVELQADKVSVKVVTRAGGAVNTNPADRPFHLTATC